MSITATKKAGLDNRGIGLLVIIIAIFVFFAASVISLFLVIPIVKSHKKGGGEKSYSQLIAEELVKELQSQNTDSPNLENDYDNQDLDDTEYPDHSRTTTREGEIYNIVWNIADDSPEPGMKTVRVIVQHNDSDYRVTTYIRETEKAE